MATGKNTKQAEATRQQVLAQAQSQLANQQLAQNPYRPGSLTKGIKGAIDIYQKKKLMEMQGGPGATPTGPEELGFTSPEELGNVLQYDEDLKNAAVAASLGGSKTFTKKEIRRGYRKL